ncbi:hypothetical protein F5Y16DRAFT_138729 [Xylariaceae sp. FL0255]|nr:hypothetical protein F5Y16DRAFT_138729 [Xylariaceae sp. FL0255]
MSLNLRPSDEKSISAPPYAHAQSWDPHPGCALCREWAKNDWMVPHRDQDRRIASHLFHAPCGSCSKKDSSATSLCQFCRHLRMRHLSLCVSLDQLPLRILFREPDPDNTCPLCKFFLRVSRKIGQLGKRRNLAFPFDLAPMSWRAHQVQWRIRERGSWDKTGIFAIVQDNLQPLPVREELFLPAVENVRSANLNVWNNMSYVWGGESDNTDWSTQLNIAERLKILDIESLPATIRDAISACEILGERYIWVD